MHLRRAPGIIFHSGDRVLNDNGARGLVVPGASDILAIPSQCWMILLRTIEEHHAII